MRLRYLVVLLVAVVLALSGIAWGSTGKVKDPHTEKLPVSCTVQTLRPFAAKIWDKDKWKRGMPSANVTSAYSRRLSCAPPAHKKAMRRTWRRDKGAYFKYRKAMLWHHEVEPFYGCTVGGCNWWAIPVWSVNCESGGGAVGENIYGNLSDTYHGGSKWEQSLSAYHLWQEYGGTMSAYEQIWLQWETGCSGWPGS